MSEEQNNKPLNTYSQAEVDKIMNDVRETTAKEVAKQIQLEYKKQEQTKEVQKVYKQFGKSNGFNDFLKLNPELLNDNVDLLKEIQAKIKNSVYEKEIIDTKKNEVHKNLFKADENASVDKEKDLFDLSEFFVPDN